MKEVDYACCVDNLDGELKTYVYDIDLDFDGL